MLPRVFIPFGLRLLMVYEECAATGLVKPVDTPPSLVLVPVLSIPLPLGKECRRVRVVSDPVNDAFHGEARGCLQVKSQHMQADGSRHMQACQFTCLQVLVLQWGDQ